MRATGTERSRILRTRDRFNVSVQEVALPAARGSVLLVNGAFASTRATRAIWSFLNGYDLVLYDLPHIGESKAHNDPGRPLSLADEVDILIEVAASTQPTYMLAMSWGGAAALLALAENRLPVEKAIVCSFSDQLTPPMRDLLVALRADLAARRFDAAAGLITETLGAHLHPALKRANHAYLSRFLEVERVHITRHLDRLLPMDRPMLDGALGGIDTDLLFMNGELDLYTPAADARRLAAQIDGATVAAMAGMGHFLGVESKAKGVEVGRTIDRFFDGAAAGATGWRAQAARPAIRARTE